MPQSQAYELGMLIQRAYTGDLNQSFGHSIETDDFDKVIAACPILAAAHQAGLTLTKHTTLTQATQWINERANIDLTTEKYRAISFGWAGLGDTAKVSLDDAILYMNDRKTLRWVTIVDILKNVKIAR